MYKITIKNFYENGALNKEERVLYHIPIQEEEVDNIVVDPSVSGDVGKTGTLEFTIHPNHPYYHALAQMRTIMRVDYDGDTIFRGRILTIDNTMTGAKRIHCEGDLAFLLDTIQLGVPKESRQTVSLHDYITQVLDIHNQQAMESGETDKCIYPGYIPGAYPEAFIGPQQIPNDSDTFGSDSAEQTMNALESIQQRFGGFFRTRYSEETHQTYLDWYRLWFRRDLENCQPIAITQNIIDAQSNSEVDNIFTAVIPIGSREGKEIFIDGYRTDIHGANNRILVPQITQVYSESELNFGYMSKAVYEQAVEQYGIIYKIQKFQNADTQEKLWNYACDWIKNNYVGGITSYDLTAVDMHHVDNQVMKYLVGDCIPLVIHSDMASIGERNPDSIRTVVHRTLLSVKYDLHHPEKNSYTAGIPSDILNLEYGTKTTSKGKSGGSGKGAGNKGGGNKNDQDKIGGDSEMTQRELESECWNYLITAKYNNDLYNQLMQEDPTGQRAAAAMEGSHIRLMGDVRGMEVLEDGSLAEQLYGRVTTVTLDARMGALNFIQPVVEFLGFDDAGRQITDVRTRTSLEIDGFQGYLRMRGLPNYREATDPNDSMSVLWDGIRGRVADEILNDPVMAASLDADTRGAMMRFRSGETDSEATTSATVNGSAGILGGVFGAFGNDGSGDTSTATTLLNGLGNGGTGSLDVGKIGGEWLIHMNEPLQYFDEATQTTVTIPNGTIDASDYAMLKGAKKIASFTTEFAAIDEAIINRATIKQLEVTEGKIDTLNSRVGNIETLISDYADIKKLFSISGNVVNLTASNVTVSDTLTANTVSVNNLKIKNRPMTAFYVKDTSNQTVQVYGYRP